MMSNHWKLKIVSGPQAGKSYSIQRDRTVIGRVKGDIRIKADAEISGAHAEISFNRNLDTFAVRDLKSRNGTRVNDQRVETRTLAPGDRIRIGVTELLLEASPPQVEIPWSRPLRWRRTLWQAFFAPVSFFDHLSSEKRDTRAFRFAACNWLLGCGLTAMSAALSLWAFRLTSDWLSAILVPAASLVNLVLIPVLVPLVAAAFHLACRALGGRASFAVALRVISYLTATAVASCLLDLIPVVGKYASLIPKAYAFALLAIAAVRVYGARKTAVSALATACAAMACAGILIAQSAAVTTKENLLGPNGAAGRARLNPLLLIYVLREAQRDSIREMVVAARLAMPGFSPKK